MRDVRPAPNERPRNPSFTLTLAAVLFAISAVGCANDTPNPTGPRISGMSGPAEANVQDENAIVVANSAELVAALVPENAGRRIRVRAGDYSLTQLLAVPDQATLEGEGIMLFDGGLPIGFAAGTRTTLTMTANAPGNVLTLGDGVTVRGIAIQDMAGRVGNSIAVVSRDAGDQLSATIEEVEVVNPNTHAVVTSGPGGCAVAVVTQNPNMGADPPPHAGAAIAARLTRSLIRSTATGTGCGLFAFNFAPVASISVALTGNVVVGGIILSGGVSRPDAVHDSRTEIKSKRNLYRNDSPDLCAPSRIGWNSQGGSGTPVPLGIAATERNALRIHSLDDRIEGFTTGVLSAGGRSFFAAPIAGPTTDNSVDLKLLGTTITTPSCGGATSVADFRLAGALVSNPSLDPGNGNTLRAVIRGVTGSGLRSNAYADVLGPAGAAPPAIQGTGNRLELAGNLHAFGQTNNAIDPAPGPEFFTSNK